MKFYFIQYKLTLAFVSKVPNTEVVRETLRTIFPLKGTIPSAGTILMLGERSCSQTCNWIFREKLNYSLKCSVLMLPQECFQTATQNRGCQR